MNNRRGRFAPSPTGYMHLGNLWIALLSYVTIKSIKGDWILRIEDIDLQRSKEIYIEGILYDLEWLHMNWDEEPYLQSKRYDIYKEVLKQLFAQDYVYPCYCNRARLQEISSAPHRDDAVHLYDGHCRNVSEKELAIRKYDKEPSYRLKVYDREEQFFDQWQGLQDKTLKSGFDDFVLYRSDHMVAYHLAVVVDDYLMGITDIVRGNDLLDATFQQKVLQDTLGYPIPTYHHAPLLVDSQGYRLSKRQKSITLKELRESGFTPRMVIQELLRKTKLINEEEIYKVQTVQDLVGMKLSKAVLKNNEIIVV